MRILYLPIARRQSVVFWQAAGAPPVRRDQRLDDKVIERAVKVWDGFAHSQTRWKLTIVRWGNRVLEQIPLAEWNMRAVPSLGRYRRATPAGDWVDPRKAAPASGAGAGGAGAAGAAGAGSTGKLAAALRPVQLVYPATAVSAADAQRQLAAMAEAGLSLYRRRLILCAVGLPLTLPFALLPVVPNLPGFYLMFRMYSYWTALQGARHVQWLVKTGQLEPVTLPALDRTYELAAGAATEAGAAGAAGADAETSRTVAATAAKAEATADAGAPGLPAEGLSAEQLRRLEAIFASPLLSQELERGLKQVAAAAKKERQHAAAEHAKRD